MSRRGFSFVMSNIDDAPGLAPKIFRFSDVDEFRSSIRGLNVEFTPFVRRIAAEQVILRLPGCDVNVTRAFPRVVDAQLVADCTAVGFAMDDLEVPIRFNGAKRDRAVIVIGSNGAAYNTIEEVQRQIASIEGTVAMCRASRSADALDQVQEELESVLSAALAHTAK